MKNQLKENIENKNVNGASSQTTDLILTEQHYDLISQINRINNKLKDSFNNFIQIGYELSKIKKEKSYELLNYSSIEEFAMGEFELGCTSVKNYIGVANKFGNPNSNLLDDKYKDYSLSQLVELISVENIDEYSPVLSVREIRSLKVVEKQKGYVKEFLKWINKFVPEFKEKNKDIYKLDYNMHVSNDEYPYCYIYTGKNHYNCLFEVNFCKGKYSFYERGHYINNYEFDLSLDKFKKKFEELLIKISEDEIKRLAEEKANKEKEKQREIDSLPENEKGISDEERVKRRLARQEQEHIDKQLKNLKKIKDYRFGSDCRWLGIIEQVKTFQFFCILNKIEDVDHYELMYTHLVDGHFERMVGLFIKEGHFRFYEDYIEKYNYKTKAFEIIFQLSSEVSSLLNLFKDLFSDSFIPYYSNEENNKLTINRPRIDMILTLLNNTKEYNQFS